MNLKKKKYAYSGMEAHWLVGCSWGLEQTSATFDHFASISDLVSYAGQFL